MQRWWWVAVLVAWPTAVRADWPMARHDPERTGASTGSARLDAPAAVWSRYLGGNASDVRALDVDADGGVEVVLVVGGRLIVKSPNDVVVWDSPSLGLEGIVGSADLDGDGSLEIVASARPARVYVFDAASGALRWQTLADTFGYAAHAYLADLDGDGRTDLFVENVGCGNPGPADVAWAYTFPGTWGSGVEDAETRLWQLEQGRQYYCTWGDSILDFDGDGDAEIVSFARDYVYLFDARTGEKLSSGTDAAPVYGGFELGFTIHPGYVLTVPADVNGDGTPEVVGFTDSGGTYASRRVFVVDVSVNPAAPGAAVLWDHSAPDPTTDTHTFVGNGVVDLDGDGDVEVLSSFDVAGAGATTYVYDGQSGDELTSIGGGTVAGVFDTAGGTLPLVLVDTASGLTGYRFPTFTAAPTSLFTIGTAHVIESGLTLPDPDGTHRAVVLGTDSALQLWTVAGTSAGRSVAEYDLGTRALASLTRHENVGGVGEGLLVGRSDGYITVLDAALHPLVLGGGEFLVPEIRTGGYYTGTCTGDAPVAGRFDDPRDAVLVRDSRGVLLRLDADGASRVVPPAIEGEWRGASPPLLFDVEGDGTLDVIAISDTEASEGPRTLSARGADLSTAIWSLLLPTTAMEMVLQGGVPLQSESAGARFVFAVADQGTGMKRVYGVDAAGNRIFVSAPPATVLAGGGLISALDIDADGTQDALFDPGPLHAYSGLDGAVLASHGAPYPRASIVVRGRAGDVDLVGAGSGGSGASGAYRIEPNGATPPYRFAESWILPDELGPQLSCLGAVLECSDGLRFATAQGGTAQLIVADAATGALHYATYLASGEAFDSMAAVNAAGAHAGTLGNVTAIAQLRADTPAFIVGGTDGYLYALDACSAAPRVLWAMNFRAPVGEAIFADTDGDDEDEIVVSVADGYIYGIDAERFPAPAWVHDVEPGARLDDDVDEVTGTGLGAAWAPVEGATRYECAAFTIDGTPVTGTSAENPFEAPRDSRCYVEGSRLMSGRAYYFAVRAIGAAPDQISTETTSNGVVFTAAGLPDGGVPSDASVGEMVDAGDDAGVTSAIDAGTGGGPASGCACSSAGAPRASSAKLAGLLALLAFLVVWRRGRRSRDRREYEPRRRPSL